MGYVGRDVGGLCGEGCRWVMWGRDVGGLCGEGCRWVMWGGM